jgi:hypothetical protein
MFARYPNSSESVNDASFVCLLPTPKLFGRIQRFQRAVEKASESNGDPE